MPSTENATAAAVVAALVLAYATLIATELLLGLVAAGAVGLAVAAGDAVVRDVDRPRMAVVAAAALGGTAYFVVLGRLLVGATVGALVVLVGWVTAPRGPVVRAARWVRAARDDIRLIRDAVEGDTRGPDSDPDD